MFGEDWGRGEKVLWGEMERVGKWKRLERRRERGEWVDGSGGKRKRGELKGHGRKIKRKRLRIGKERGIVYRDEDLRRQKKG